MDANDETIANSLLVAKFLGDRAQLQNFGPFTNTPKPLGPSNVKANAYTSVITNLH
jgi:hypothetical protein